MSYQFHYTIDSNKDLPLVLFLHGFLGSNEDFSEVISLVSKQFCCLSLDLPGHGETRVVGEDERYTMPETAAAIVQLLNHLNIPDANLVGYSMGGRLALHLALHYADRFPKVILESASPGLKTEAERLARIQHDFALAERIETNFPQFLADWYEQPLFRSFKQHPNFEQMMQKRLRNNPVELAKSLRNMSTGLQPSLWKNLENHQNSLLLMVGENDRKFITINQDMASICPRAKLAIVSNAGHNIHAEQPITYANQIAQFLSCR
jgi:2-succinyl-6-hydroxy-2,4-cyclohexadiene-1-carboxylate synthase